MLYVEEKEVQNVNNFVHFFPTPSSSRWTLFLNKIYYRYKSNKPAQG